jgi:hypothetical protein
MLPADLNVDVSGQLEHLPNDESVSSHSGLSYPFGDYHSVKKGRERTVSQMFSNLSEATRRGRRRGEVWYPTLKACGTAIQREAIGS